MELHQLKTFYQVATLLNFSKAAEIVSLSQPAVSRQIEALEKFFDLKLFHRIGKRVELTEAGRRLLQYTEQIINLCDQAEKSMHSLKNLDEGELKIGASTTFGNYILPPLILKFREKYPQIKTSLVIDKTDTIVELLVQNKIDIAIIAKTVQISNIYHQPLIADQIQLIVPSNHKLLDAVKSLDLYRLQNETFILRPIGSNTRDCVEKLFEDTSFQPSHIIEFVTNEAIKQAIINGYGVGFLSNSVCRMEIQNGLIHTIDLQHPCRREFSIIYKKGQFTTPISLIFSSFLSKNIRTVIGLHKDR